MAIFRCKVLLIQTRMTILFFYFIVIYSFIVLFYAFFVNSCYY